MRSHLFWALTHPMRSLLSRKRVRALKEKAQKDADKLAKTYAKLQRRADKEREREQRRLMEERRRMQEDAQASEEAR